MTHVTPRTLLTLFAGFSLLATSTLHAAEKGIKDLGNAFSAESRTAAAKQIEDIRQLYDTDLVIEFSPSVPQSTFWEKAKKQVLELKQPASRRRFYVDWATRSARTAGPDSIYILICGDPAPLHVEIASGPNVRQQPLFPDSDAARLRQQLQDLLQEGRNDEALNEAVNTVRSTLQANILKRPTPRESVSWAELFTIIGAFTAVYLGLVLVSRVRSDPPLVSWDTSAAPAGSYAAGLYATATSRWVHQLASLRTLRRHNSPVSATAADSEDDAAALHDSHDLEQRG